MQMMVVIFLSVTMGAMHITIVIVIVIIGRRRRVELRVMVMMVVGLVETGIGVGGRLRDGLVGIGADAG
jgi:hypothetical protein